MKNSFMNLIRQPDRAAAELESGWVQLEKTSVGWTAPGLCVTVSPDEQAQSASVTLLPSSVPVKRIRLRWQGDNRAIRCVLRDSWCVSARDLAWTPVAAEQPMPWYFQAHDGTLTHGYGVMTGCDSFVFWQMDTFGINLWLDVRCGGDGVILTSPLTAATVVTREGKEGESAFRACQAFCERMCPHPALPGRPVYGLNNWYYAYGEISAQSVLADADLTYDLAGDTPYKPYMVIDDGWGMTKTGGPFDRGNRFMGDMQTLAGQISDKGCIPGIWIRPLMTTERFRADWLHPYKTRCTYWNYQGEVLDPSHPGVLEYVAETARRMDDWGYRYIKYDFTCPDVMGEESFYGWKLTGDGWHWRDRSRTTAQVVRTLYQTIRSAAPNCLLQGCNAYNHLAAGVNHLQRSGLDTSGSCWEVTRLSGVNSLAFRLPQNNRFFMIDADCPAFTPKVSAEMNLRFMEAAALSGSVLIASITPGLLTEAEKKRARKAFQTAASGKSMEPLDWMNTNCPSSYLYEGDGEVHVFDWYTPTDGAEMR